MSIKAETRNAIVPELQKIIAVTTLSADGPLSLADPVELALLNHQAACFLWLAQQRDWGTAVRNGKVRSCAAVEDHVWLCAADEEFMQGVTRDLHAAAFAEIRQELESPPQRGHFLSLVAM